MKAFDKIASILFRIGSLISLIGVAVLAYFNFFCPTIQTEKFDLVLIAVFVGSIMMLMSIAMDFVTTAKKKNK